MEEHTEAGTFIVPTTEQAERALRELDWSERLTISKMNPATGTENVDVYNLEHAVLHLFGTRWDNLLVDGSKSGIAYVDMERLVAWLHDAIEDGALATAVAERVAAADSYKDQVIAVQPLFHERVAQYHTALAAMSDA